MCVCGGGGGGKFTQVGREGRDKAKLAYIRIQSAHRIFSFFHSLILSLHGGSRTNGWKEISHVIKMITRQGNQRPVKNK